MNPLEAALRPIARVLNRNIRETTPARELCGKLDGTVVAVRVRDTALTAWFLIRGDELELTADHDGEPDVAISGSLVTLARLAGNAGLDAVRKGDLEITGDAHSAERFQRLLAYAKPDFEEELSTVVGDAAAHRVGEVVRGIGKWGREARSTMGANIREYLQEESRDAPSRYEADRFAADVDALRDDVERLEARIDRLRGED
ncbi:MAG: SCP2 sterol-binding domain-containing protein [Proteobacteria bacterium]|nr:SCP2 sterol-binding domain-containing protein [Pseudomonadota bacterium]